MHYETASFLLSAAAVKQLPEDKGCEIAFVGRSNSGKSSALNTLTRQRNLAKTSKTPGRTRLINVFALNDDVRLIDLPGYGYAKVTAKEQQKWSRLIENYLQTRDALIGLVLLMDIRHPLKPLDQQMLSWAQQVEMPVHILLTKADKLTRGAQAATLQSLRRTLDLPQQDLISVQVFSSLSRLGLPAFREKLDAWLSEAGE